MHGSVEVAGAGAAMMAVGLLGGCSSGSVESESPAELRQETINESNQRPEASTEASQKAQQSEGYVIAAYVPTWLGDDDCRSYSAELSRTGVNRLLISFALPTPEGGVQAPTMSPACVNALQELAVGSEVYMAVGGWGGSDAEHEYILANFAYGAENPEQFAAGMNDAVGQLEQTLGVQISGVDIDWEYPLAGQADVFADMLRTLRETRPDRSLTVAAPAGGFEFPVDGINDHVDAYHVMTYDKSGSWSPVADDMAPGIWTIQMVDDWVQEVGDSSKVIVGYPAYLYQFNGASARGDTFDQSNVVTVPYNALSRASSVDDDTERLTTEVVLDGAWTSGVSPNVINETQRRITSNYPNIGGAFYWSAESMTQEHVEAVKLEQANDQ